jgi:hypothetical protein
MEEVGIDSCKEVGGIGSCWGRGGYWYCSCKEEEMKARVADYLWMVLGS